MSIQHVRHILGSVCSKCLFSDCFVREVLCVGVVQHLLDAVSTSSNQVKCLRGVARGWGGVGEGGAVEVKRVCFLGALVQAKEARMLGSAHAGVEGASNEATIGRTRKATIGCMEESLCGCIDGPKDAVESRVSAV